MRNEIFKKILDDLESQLKWFVDHKHDNTNKNYPYYRLGSIEAYTYTIGLIKKTLEAHRL